MRQPTRLVHLLFSLRAQHDRALRVEKRGVKNPDFLGADHEVGSEEWLQNDPF